MNYRKVNNLVGWITGAIATIVFLKTMEPTASFWDCGEFLSCAYKLEVGHSPGAPFFMLLQRLFGIIAPSPAKAAMFINAMSAIMSGLTILFLFWTITHMAKKLLAPGNIEPTDNQTMLIMGAGLVGGLAYTFTDTFWFSAVEAEVYATSSFFTAITFWAILKWENIADNKYADRWLILISYLIGISVCVHLLNLLTIPALAMVYYYRRYNATTAGAIIAFVAGCVLLGLVQFGIIQYIPLLASKVELLFVNSFGMPIDSGAITFVLLVIALLVWGLFYARKKNLYLVHTSILCVLFILIGYSSYITAIIRSRADVPIDMTNPDNVISFLSYVNREQFGQQPLLYGPDYTSIPSEIKDKGDVYSLTKKDGKTYYEVVGKKLEPVYDASQMRFFPRIWDNNDPMHIQFYQQYLGKEKDETPTSADNMKYFFGYQMNWMWWRYFMWNYVGRQNDVEGQEDARGGNWISGIKFIDKGHVGDIDLMSDGFRNNGARNQLYFLPLILGVLGLIFQFNRNSKDGVITLTLFFFTGAAIGIYLNMPPVQPRERDYAFAGCTYAFAIWIGLGILMVYDLLGRSVKGPVGVIGTIALCTLAVPVLMAKEEWNDHDRSKKTLARDVAYNTLQSCAPNAILFTAGDNQTYPLWYLQQVEGIRRDVRIINTSLLGIDWYIDQLNYRVDDADAVPMQWKRDGYIGDHLNYLRYAPNPAIPADKYVNLAEICDFITSDNPGAKKQVSNGEAENYLPTKNFFVNTPSKADLVKLGLVKAEDTARINTEMKFTYPKGTAYKSDIAILNIVAGIAKEGWKRPIYFDADLPADNYVGMADYMKLEGIVERVMPYKVVDSIKDNNIGFIDLDKSYDLFMKTYNLNAASGNEVYYDEPNRREFFAYRINASVIANAFSERGMKNKAVNVLDKVMHDISQHSNYYDYTGYMMAVSYYRADAKDKARNLVMKIVKNADDDIRWFGSLNENRKATVVSDIGQHWQMVGNLGNIAMMSGDSATASSINAKLQAWAPQLNSYINLRGSRQ